MKKIISVLILAAVAFTYASGQNKPQGELKTITGPAIEFESKIYDYGKVPINSDGSCFFKFKNIGTEPLILTNVKASCGCTVPAWPREPIAPGETGIINVKYTTMSRAHTINKTITVTSNAVNETTPENLTGQIILSLRGEVFDNTPPVNP